MTPILIVLTVSLAVGVALAIVALLAHAIHADRFVHHRHLRVVDRPIADPERLAA